MADIFGWDIKNLPDKPFKHLSREFLSGSEPRSPMCRTKNMSWSVCLSADRAPIHMDLPELLSIFPTLDLTYDEAFIPPNTQETLWKSLSTVPGKCTEGDTRIKYACSDCHVTPNWTHPRPFSELRSHVASALRGVQKQVTERLGKSPNYALVNVYRDGHDEILWHADDMEGVTPGSSVASVSVGAERLFQFRPYLPGYRGRTESWPIISTRPKSGSLLVMGQQTNEYWCHSVPTEPSETLTRVNITFRYLEEWKGSEDPVESPGTANYRRLETIHRKFEKTNHPVFSVPKFQQLMAEHNLII